MKQPIRRERKEQQFELECHQCGELVEVPVAGPHACPHCSATLTIEWRTPEAPFTPAYGPFNDACATEHNSRGLHGRDNSESESNLPANNEALGDDATHDRETRDMVRGAAEDL